MSYEHYFEPKALKEYITALKWYQERSYLAAPNFVKEMDAAINTICKDPFRFRIGYKQFHEIALKKYPFYIIYTVDETKKLILIFLSFILKEALQKKYRKR